MGNRRHMWTACLWFMAVPTIADVLVMRDGQRLETAGPWRVEGNVVVFDRSGGGLGSVRASGVDFAASALSESPGREEKQQATPAQPKSARKPGHRRLRVTEDELAKRRRPSPADRVASPAMAERARAQASSQLTVDTWATAKLSGAGGLEIAGLLKNESSVTIEVRGVVVDLLTRDGELIATQESQPEERLLAAGVSTRFRVEFHGRASEQGRPKFRVESVKRLGPGA